MRRRIALLLAAAVAVGALVAGVVHLTGPKAAGLPAQIGRASCRERV